VKIRLVLIVACCLAFAGCGTMSKLWPFGKQPKPGPEAVSELQLVNADGSPASLPQYWVRNTLVIDLTGVSGAGSVAARLPEETVWPVRMAVRVLPGSVQQIEIQGEERNVLAVSADGTKPIDIELAPSVYTLRTAAIYISWGSMPVFAEAPPPAVEPAFVSPTALPQVPSGGDTPGADGSAEPSASDIIPPGSAAPDQPAQPPPGS
jgi:hypothetical protein